MYIALCFSRICILFTLYYHSHIIFFNISKNLESFFESLSYFT